MAMECNLESSQPASGIRKCHRQWLPECRCLSCRHLADYSFGSMLAGREAAELRTNPSLRTTSCPQVLVLWLLSLTETVFFSEATFVSDSLQGVRISG